MNHTILVLMGQSKYNVLRKATLEMVEGFEKNGYQTDIIDLTSENAISELENKFLRPYTFIFSCQAFCFEQKVLAENAVNPWYGWTFDDIMYHFPRLQNTTNDWMHLYSVDFEMIKIGKMMCPNVTHLRAMLHGGFEPTKKLSASDKTIDILFPGSVGKKPIWEDFNPNPMPIETLFAQECLDCLHNFPELSVRDALEKVLNKYGEILTTDYLLELSSVIHYVDELIRYECKYQILETLLKNNVHLHLIGEGHDELVSKYKDHVTMLGAQDIEGVLRCMEQAKIVINPLPPVFKQGLHERIYSAMLRNATCFMPYSDFAKNELGEHIKLFSMNELDQLPTMLQKYLEEYKFEETIPAYEYATQHTWACRAAKLIQDYEKDYPE